MRPSQTSSLDTPVIVVRNVDAIRLNTELNNLAGLEKVLYFEPHGIKPELIESPDHALAILPRRKNEKIAVHGRARDRVVHDRKRSYEKVVNVV